MAQALGLRVGRGLRGWDQRAQLPRVGHAESPNALTPQRQHVRRGARRPALARTRPLTSDGSLARLYPLCYPGRIPCVY